MRITLGNFVLANHDSTAPVEISINGQRLIQSAEFLRGDATRYFNRKNRSTEITFNVWRKHASIRAAGAYMLEHETAVPDEGLLTIEEMDASGALTRRYLANAVCDRVQSARLGVSTNHLYFIRGGKMLTTKPTS